MSGEDNFQDEEHFSRVERENDEGVAGASARTAPGVITTDEENDGTLCTSIWEVWNIHESFHYKMNSAKILAALDLLMGTGTPASRGESLASNGDHAQVNLNDIDDSSYGASGGESFLSVRDTEDIVIINRGNIVSQETSTKSDVCIRERVTEDYGTVNLAQRRPCNLIMRGQSRLNNHPQFPLTFTYRRQGVNGCRNIVICDTVEPATMIVPSGAYYSNNQNLPMSYPIYRNPVSENVHSGPDQWFNTDDAYSFGPLSQRDQSYESHSDQGFDESSVYEENNDE